MQANISVGLLELSSIAKGIETVDAMCKMAGINVEIAFPISQGKYVIMISGPVGEVESSLGRGEETAGGNLVSRYIIRNIHKGVLEALDKKLETGELEAVGVIETKDALSAVFSADAALKAAQVRIIELRVGKGIGGKGYFTVTGEVGAVRTAISAGVKAVGEESVVNRVVIPNAHKDVAKAL